MTINTQRRQLIQSLSLLPAASLLGFSPWAKAATELRISHQFPGGTLTSGDFRDRLCRQFAVELDKQSHGALKAVVYANSSLMKTKAQFAAMRRAALDMALIPLDYAGGEVPETNIGLMPGIITSYKKGVEFKTSEAGKMLYDVLESKGILLVSWVWQAGGVASRNKAIIDPNDAKGLKVRGGSRGMELILREAGASVMSIPSNEIYASMQTGALDAAMTSSTSLMSFRLEEVAKELTTGRDKTYWFMFEPLMISRDVFNRLGKPEQDLIMTVGAQMENFALTACKADDQKVAEVYMKSGGHAHDMNQAIVGRWQEIAKRTAWQDFANRSPSCAKLLKAAEKLV
ncbi:C4-dicarboxylate-binding periplasmic protein precursor [Ferrovum sp. JA12]|uniref:TRAP transporter substrate-binding protein DctP n=1 Tax=Ferrovum sp. JA12 TaxID=1356299 RepID=UPI0007161468|nr:TRAP transporter substrate-binding protein DctP [Ferrovum sp. JA12]KRH78045.1 C4-dicarboxylate-binding periplasmic protein precursor [Ferrovum sp. JA12]HQT81915.1 TRAP transporter substrate-binding protein DctP [Ferrovaceae bacterium]HQU07082.1 TRAP transporter substrate-binding protein DctP [Ferrovaceae bacterium]